MVDLLSNIGRISQKGSLPIKGYELGRREHKPKSPFSPPLFSHHQIGGGI